MSFHPLPHFALSTPAGDARLLLVCATTGRDVGAVVGTAWPAARHGTFRQECATRRGYGDQRSNHIDRIGGRTSRTSAGSAGAHTT